MKNEIFKLLEEKVDLVYLYFQDKLNIGDGGILPELALRQDEILEELAELIDKVLTIEKMGRNEKMGEKWEEIYDVLDNMNIKYDTNYCDSETEAIIEFWTDTAGQDVPIEFDYDGTPEDFVKRFTERANSYDVDEEVELFVDMRGKNGVPNTVRELLDDCQEAKDTLMEIAEKLQGAIA